MKNCPQCNSQNIDEAKFCEKCGNAFEYGDTYKESVTNEEPKSSQIDLNGVSEVEFAAYVGKNQNDFIPAFRKFCNGQKVSFSPLVFLLSWLVSPLAGAFWFLHRRINKIGAVVLAIAVALSVASGVVAVCVVDDVIETTVGYIGEVAEYDSYNNEYYIDEYNSLDDYERYMTQEFVKELVQNIMKYGSVTTLLGLLKIAFAVVLGLFAKYFYFKEAADKILIIKQKNPTMSYMNDVVSAGGTKCIGWVIGVVICVFAAIAFGCGLAFSIVSQVMNIIY